MLLIRGIKGHQYAKNIEKGIIGFRDLLSTLASPKFTGYQLSGFDEYHLRAIACRAMKELEYEQQIPTHNIEKVKLISNAIIPYCYVSYFHIVNENTREWIDSFSSDFEFVYINPKIDKVSNNMIDEHLLGRKIEYVQKTHDYKMDDFIRATYGGLCLLEEDFIQDPELEPMMQHTGIMYHILYAFFTRRVNGVFTSQENEFRMLYKIPTVLDSNGFYSSPEPRLFQMQINSFTYNGYTILNRYPNGTEKIDTYLYTDSPMLVENTTTLITEVVKGYDFQVYPEFKDVDIKECVHDYGYIGNKDDCIRFIESASRKT